MWNRNKLNEPCGIEVIIWERQRERFGGDKYTQNKKKKNKQTAGTTTERQLQNRQTKHKNKTKILEDAYMQDMK